MKRYIYLLLATLTLFVGTTIISLAENAAPANPEKAIVAEEEVTVAPTTVNLLGVETPVQTSFWLDRIPYAKTQFQGTPLWQYAAFLIYLVLAYFISKLLCSLLFSFLHKWLIKKENVNAQMALNSLKSPSWLIIFVVFLKIGLELYQWPQWMTNILAQGFKLIVAISVTYAFVKLVDILFSIWKNKSNADPTFTNQIIPLFNRIAKYIVIFIGLLTMASNLGVDVTSILALGSVGGLAVGLATQDLLNNIFGGIVVFLDRPFHLGDRITVEGKDGVVESIGLRSTRIRSLDGFLITVPNKTICNSLITNITSRPTIKTEINIGLTYDTTTEQLKKAIAIITEVYKSHPKTTDVIAYFDVFGASSLDIKVYHWHKADDWAVYVKDLESMSLEIKKRFDAEKLSFAFPTRTLYVKQDSNWKVDTNK